MVPQDRDIDSGLSEEAFIEYWKCVASDQATGTSVSSSAREGASEQGAIIVSSSSVEDSTTHAEGAIPREAVGEGATNLGGGAILSEEGHVPHACLRGGHPRRPHPPRMP